jgi:hypothetical protein
MYNLFLTEDLFHEARNIFSFLPLNMPHFAACIQGALNVLTTHELRTD